MTSTTMAPPARLDRPRSPRPRRRESRWRRLCWAVSDSLVLTWRSVARIAREPETLMDVTVQPLMFVLLFAYVFGGAIGLPGGGSYHEYLIGGMFGMGIAGTRAGNRGRPGRGHEGGDHRQVPVAADVPRGRAASGAPRRTC